MTGKTQINMDSVSADKLPVESGWSYDEIAKIIGSLYLDSHHRISTIEQQFASISKDYQHQLTQANNDVKNMRLDIDKLTSENSQLKRELEIHNDESGSTTTSSDVGDS
jgi:cell shape-determining protein MreC